MKYPCELIRDLLPLYHDGVCSAESAAAVEAHLTDCEACQTQYQALRDSDALAPAPAADAEQKKADSLRRVKKSIRGKRILACVLSVLAVLALSGGAAGYLHETRITVPQEDIAQIIPDSVGLQARIEGNTYEQASSKLVETQENGKTITSVYFCLQSTLWNQTWAEASHGGAFYTIAYAGKGAEKIDRVYYYAGDLESFRQLTTDQLEQGIPNAVLVWSTDA